MAIVEWTYYPNGWTISDRNAVLGNINLFHKGLMPTYWTSGFGSGSYADWWIMILRLDSNNWNAYYSNTICAPGSACRTNLGSFFYEFPKESNNIPVDISPREWTNGSIFTVGKVGIYGPEQSNDKRYWGFFGLVPDSTVYSIDIHTGFDIAIPENVDSFCNDNYDLLSGISRDFVTGDIFNYNISNGILFGISTSGQCVFNGKENFVLVVKSNGTLYRGNYTTGISPGTQHSLSVRSFEENTILSVDGVDRVTVPSLPLGKLKPLWGIASFSDNTGNGTASPEVYFKNITISTLSPADIISTTLTVNTNQCYSPCTITGSVTWTNNGDVAGTFNPSIIVNNSNTINLGNNVSIGPNNSDTITRTFSLPNYPSDIYTICASPGTHCQTVNITTCIQDWQCRQPLDGYEHDINNCGESDRLNPDCNPCVPNWQCRQPLDGYEHDINNCGESDRLNPDCNSPLGTITISPISISLHIGDTQTLTAECKNQLTEVITCPTLVWLSSDNSIVTVSPTSPIVNSECLIIAISPGVANISCSNGNIMSNNSEIRVLTPANIISTTIIPSSTTCTESCDITVDVTWTNTGETTGSFIPSIKIDDIPINPEQYAQEDLIPEDIITHTFTITGLMEGNHTICAVPGGAQEESCTTIIVTKVVEEGFNGLGMIIGTGLLFGMLLSSDECKKYKTKDTCEKAGCQWEDGRCIKKRYKTK
jgi:hypothetical protein